MQNSPETRAPRQLYIGWGTADFRPCGGARQPGLIKGRPDGYLDRGTGLRFSFGTARLVDFRVNDGSQSTVKGRKQRTLEGTFDSYARASWGTAGCAPT